jgi:hypothetical protein
MVNNLKCRAFLTGFILCFLTFTLTAQEALEPRQLFVEAESFFLFEEYKDALPLYQRILRTEPNNYNVIYKVGICYINDIYQAEKAIKYLEQATQNINPDCRPNSFKEKQAPTDAYYYLGKAYHISNKLDQAIESYQRFKKQANPEAYDLTVVEEDIAACQYAKKAIISPIYFSAKNLGEPVDTKFEEVNPVISGDGKTLIFTRKLQFYDAVFLSKKNENGIWSEPENLTSSFGLDGSSFTTGISFSGDEIFVYRSDNFDGNIYSSQLKNNQWSKLAKLNENINTKFWESHASLSPDGQYLIFTSNRDGGYGGLDIYKSRRNSKGEWGPAVNMGPVINSPSNEETPFLSNNGYTIFFSSQGNNTFGGYDIFISNLRSDGTWSKPRNMGYPLNSTSDDIFYSPTGINSIGLFSTYKNESTQGLLDIYQIEVYNELIPRQFTVEGAIKIPGGENNVFNNIKVKIYDAQSKSLISEKAVLSDGSFSIKASQGEYLLTVEGPGIKPIQKELSLSLTQSSSVVKLNSITAEKSEILAEPLIAATPEKEKIFAKNDFFAVTDGSTVPIELIVPKGSKLHVEVLLNDSLAKIEDINDVKKRFTYFYTPREGENVLKFTATDPEGNLSETLVTVTYYTPPAPAISAADDLNNRDTSLKSEALARIATGNLADYLDSLDLSAFDNYLKLYEHLIAVASKEGFTPQEVQHLFSIFFTQRDLESFSNGLAGDFSGNDSLLYKASGRSSIPLDLLKTLVKSGVMNELELSNLLLAGISREGVSGEELFSGLIDFSGSGTLHTEAEIAGITPQQAWELFAGEQDDENAGNILKLIATTDDFDFFYQRLLLSSDGSLNDYLKRIQLESLGIRNAVDLSDFLFSLVSDTTFSVNDLITSLHLATVNKQFYINSFTELLTTGATGSLKSQLLLSSSELQSYNSFEGMLNYLLNQSQYKNYSKESVYDLLLNLIGIDDVEEFASKIKVYGYSSINQAIMDTTMNHFSNPLELIQYLLMASQNYNYTQSDINNLLIRMILERGLKDRIKDVERGFGKKFWKSKKFIPTVILVNIVLIILIVLFRLRRKKH